jgi:hypothetical protein
MTEIPQKPCIPLGANRLFKKRQEKAPEILQPLKS